MRNRKRWSQKKNYNSDFQLNEGGKSERSKFMGKICIHYRFSFPRPEAYITKDVVFQRENVELQVKKLNINQIFINEKRNCVIYKNTTNIKF